MQICEQYVDHQSTIEIIGTDLSRAMLDQAKSGSYSDIEIRRGVSEERRRRFFRSDGRRWKLDDNVQSLVRFQPLNVCTDPAPFSDVDLILIRNVLIYLNDSARDRILSLSSDSLAENGLLILGATETLYQHAALFARRLRHLSLSTQRLKRVIVHRRATIVTTFASDSINAA